MACYRPLHLVNPKIDPTLRDKVFLDVPCGQCAECRKRKQNDWYVRSYFEYLDCKNHGGTTFFITLTYNDWSLPLFEDTPVFDPTHVQAFIKRLRQRLKRFLGLDCLRYVICSEYGSLTARPHYHGLLYVFTPLTFYQIRHIKHLITDCWLPYHGFVNFGRKGTPRIRGVVENTAAVHYVCKYICKDLDFPVKEIPRDFHPFHLQSAHFGEYMVEHYGLKKSSFEAFNMLVDGSFVLGSDRQYPYAIPQYITKKCLYDYRYQMHKEVTFHECSPYIMTAKRYETHYDLNELGRKVKYEQDCRSIEFKILEFNRIFENYSNLLSQFTSDEVADILSRNPISYHNMEVSAISEFLNNTYLNYSENEKLSFALYATIFKDRVCLPNVTFSDNDSPLLSDMRAYLDQIYADDVYSLDKIGIKMPSKGDTDYKNALRYIYSNTYASYLDPDKVDEYDTLLAIFNSLVYYIGIHDEEKVLVDLRNYNNQRFQLGEVV